MRVPHDLRHTAVDATGLSFLVRACDCQAAADDNVPTAFVILVKAPEPNFIEGVKSELAEIKDSATAAINGRSPSEYVSCVEQMTAMYSKGQGHARMSKVLDLGLSHKCHCGMHLQGYDAHAALPHTGWPRRSRARSQTRPASSRSS